MILCKYGCGKEAKFLSRGKNPCCSPHQSQCEAIRSKLSLINKNFEKCQCQFCQNFFTKYVLSQHEVSCRLNPIHYKIKNKVCEICGGLHDGTLGSGRFCSRSCSNKFSSSINITERRVKISKSRSLTRKYFNKNCLWCNCSFNTIKLTQKFCSRNCAGHFNANKNLEKIRECFRQSAISRHTNGDPTIGWQKRSGSSYPERYFETVFLNKKIEFEREKKIGKWFADFYFETSKLVVEIDGRQHNDEDRKQRDLLKDQYFKSIGLNVFRIKWTNPKTDSGKKYLQEKIEEVCAAIV